VFDDARGISDAQMQALALQMNLSETTFVLPTGKTEADARVRIFTPGFEIPFAGHPTLGTASVVGAGRDRVTLEMKAGLVPVTTDGATWTLKTARPPESRDVDASRAELERMLGLPADSICDRPMWINTGSDQLVIPLASFDAVRRARPSAAALARYANNGERTLAYVFAREGDDVLSRFFFDKHGAIVEDPGTGSACANLGGWLLATGASLPQHVRVDQGEAVGRRCRLDLTVASDRSVRVGGRVVELGRGTITLDL